ncbi:MAG: hypothetical protein ACYS9T_03975 [Planctomycetota bacterium]|jgi:hypothetical protein
MHDLLSMVILAASRRGFRGWGNLLFIIVVAIFYVIGSIAKAKANKAQQQDQEGPGRKPKPQPQPRPFKGMGELRQRLAEEGRRAAGSEPRRDHRPQVQPQRRRIARPQAAVRKYAAEREEAIKFASLGGIEKLSEPARPKEAGKLVGKGVTKRKAEHVAAELEETEYLAEIVSDYADPEELKRAILHYEILGRPLSVRDPSARIIGL